MRDKREIVFWSSVIFLAQILLMLAQMTQYGGDDLYQPLKFLYGDGYGRAKLHNVEQYMWLLELSLYCIVTVRKIVQYKEEAGSRFYFHRAACFWEICVLELLCFI